MCPDRGVLQIESRKIVGSRPRGRPRRRSHDTITATARKLASVSGMKEVGRRNGDTDWERPGSSYSKEPKRVSVCLCVSMLLIVYCLFIYSSATPPSSLPPASGIRQWLCFYRLYWFVSPICFYMSWISFTTCYMLPSYLNGLFTYFNMLLFFSFI